MRLRGYEVERFVPQALKSKSETILKPYNLKTLTYNFSSIKSEEEIFAVE